MGLSNRRKLITIAAALLGTVVLSGTASAQEKGGIFYGIQVEQFEYRLASPSHLVAWDGDAFVGTDEWKFRVQSEGEYARKGNAFETLQHQFLVQRPISAFFDIKAGLRLDTPAGPDRAYGVLGVRGLAPQWFEVDADLYLSERGGLSSRAEVEYELLLTNRLVLTSSAEVDIAFSDDNAIGVGSGIGAVEIGMRLSYDLIDRSVSPYLGLHYERLFGNTRDLARAEDESLNDLMFVAGVRVRF